MNMAKMYADYQKYTSLLLKHNPSVIVGFDETGNGAIAGPLCVGACALALDFSEVVKDSKRYSSENSRKKAYDMLQDKAIASVAFMVEPDEIAKVGHAAALESLYVSALDFMYEMFEEDGLYIFDGDKPVEDTEIDHYSLVKADDFIPAVSAASVVAKYERDEAIKHVNIGPWRFDKSKGYPTPDHLEMLEELGPIKGVHRMNVERVQKAFDARGWYEENE
jgi:ribonuclease HII